MEEQDKLLLTSLQTLKFNTEKQINSLNEITGDILIEICIQFLIKLGHQYKPINTTQKFRIATKISEEIQKNENIKIEISTLINPNPTELRKVLISLFSRLSMSDTQQDEHTKQDTQEERNLNTKKLNKKQIFKQWKQREWIHPALIEEQKNTNFRNYETNIELESKNFQKVLLISNFNQEIKQNLFSSLCRVLDNAQLKRIQYDRQQEKFYTGGNQKDKNILNHDTQIKDMLSKNQLEWHNVKKNQIVRLARQMKENQEQQQQQQQQKINEEQQKQVEKQIPEEKEKTLFELEQQFQQEEQNQEAENNQQKLDLDSIKKQNEEETQELKQKIEEIQKKMEKYEQKKSKMEENINKKEEEIQNYKEASQELQLNIKQINAMIENLEKGGNKGVNQLQSEVSGLQSEIQNIQTEWAKIKTQLEESIEQFQQQIFTKKQKMDQQREKAKRLEHEYFTISQDIKNAYDLKESLRQEVSQLPTSTYGRQRYLKSITEINKNFTKQKEDLQKILEEVTDMERQINSQVSVMNRYFVEFENAFNTDPKKKESLHVQIYKIYDEYRSTFKKTIKLLQDSSQSQIEVRETEGKLEQITAKGYNNSLDKLRKDLEDIKKENNQYLQQQQQLLNYRQQLLQQNKKN
ncbi:hypothetical protein PPERSA_00039 [Pseudocohnilembus persalinus]|uniref:CCDC22 coiled-coil domain-containing protein n=1 Tax=Pseudocohnilembus persalinus TaxID=266149 RepID=A0A0V0Q8G8_PSEPJ|nr:hypothetical protein PPERSA_00039 [Pseudocohnilembus persalinus]|eukprot:KRW98547.1 hypothetical protein PPERSA_00039 [Pseudocohnilembus persalinus]